MGRLGDAPRCWLLWREVFLGVLRSEMIRLHRRVVGYSNLPNQAA
jgi:hypothetical protein